MKRAILLDDEARKHFYIESISVGPRRSQRKLSIGDMCQEWENTNLTTVVSAPPAGDKTAEKVFRIKVSYSRWGGGILVLKFVDIVVCLELEVE